MNIEIEELLKYLKEIESKKTNNEYRDGYNDCLDDIKNFTKIKVNKLCNV